MAIQPMADAVSGQTASSAEYNKVTANVRDLDSRLTTTDGKANNNAAAITAIAGAWQTYNVEWTSIGSGSNPTIGNGTLRGRYKQIGKTVFLNIHLVLGTTSTLGSDRWLFSTPVAPRTGSRHSGVAILLNQAPSTDDFFCSAQFSSSVIWVKMLDGSTVGPSNPDIWNVGSSGNRYPHELSIDITYETD